MCFSVRRRHVCPGEKRRTLRKSAFCAGTLTERRILRLRRDGKLGIRINLYNNKGGASFRDEHVNTHSGFVARDKAQFVRLANGTAA